MKIEELLLRYKPAMLFVEHGRAFTDAIVILLENNPPRRLTAAPLPRRGINVKTAQHPKIPLLGRGARRAGWACLTLTLYKIQV
jgi:hypothetical protein